MRPRTPTACASARPIWATDLGGLWHEEAFVVAVLDADERPVLGKPEMSSGTNVVLQWSSILNPTYAVQSSTNLVQGFSVLSSNILATPPMNTYTDSRRAEHAAAGFSSAVTDLSIRTSPAGSNGSVLNAPSLVSLTHVGIPYHRGGLGGLSAHDHKL